MIKMAMKNKSSENGRYLYAVVATNGQWDFGPLGIDYQRVYTISDGPVSAVVSNVPDKKIRPQRRNLAAHQQVLKRLMAETTPLPMTFGIIAEGDRAVIDILARHRELFVAQCKRVSGKMEMGLRVAWDVDNIFDYFINTHPELRKARDTYFNAQRIPSQEDKLELGRFFNQLLQEDRENLTDQVETTLKTCCYEIKRGKYRNERDVMNLSCLVGREVEDRFEEGILKAAGKFDNNFTFDYNGPWAPHNFVEIELEI
jgi:hypothetical protein